MKLKNKIHISKVIKRIDEHEYVIESNRNEFYQVLFCTQYLWLSILHLQDSLSEKRRLEIRKIRTISKITAYYLYQSVLVPYTRYQRKVLVEKITLLSKAEVFGLML